jgi:hypothetical protein
MAPLSVRVRSTLFGLCPKDVALEEHRHQRFERVHSDITPSPCALHHCLKV